MREWNHKWLWWGFIPSFPTRYEFIPSFPTQGQPEKEVLLESFQRIHRFETWVMLFVSTTSSRRKPNSPNSPSATRRRKDLQVKGMLLQMLARPQGQTVRRRYILTLHDSGGTRAPSTYQRKDCLIEKPLCNLISDYQTQFTTLIRLKGVFTTKKPLGCWQKSKNHQQGNKISFSNPVWRKGWTRGRNAHGMYNGECTNTCTSWAS